MTRKGYKKPFGISKTVSAGEEIIVKNGWNNGTLILTQFDIYNTGTTVIHVRINESEELVTLNPNEGFQMLDCPVYSCICIEKGSIQASGLY
jgi:hypothetical protein